MKTKEIIKRAGELARPFRISKGKDFRLKDVDPNDTLEFTKEADKPRAKEVLTMGVKALAELQDKLYAQDKWAMLLIFQAMDAAGKDGAIKHVMSGVNPQGCDVHSFKSPSPEELNRDYLWRNHKVIPERGKIGIFNRSYYEEVLVVRVHPTFLRAQKRGMHADDEDFYIVGAIKDADLPAFGDDFVVAPEIVAVQFLRARGFERVNVAALR